MKRRVRPIIAGMGELHLEIIVDRLLREFKVEANVGKPQVAYRETITKARQTSDTKYSRQSGGPRSVRSRQDHASSPNRTGKGYEFVNEVVGGAIPKEYIRTCRCRVSRVQCSRGVLAGYQRC